MAQKHLILAIGTTGGEVALALKAQIAQRPINKDMYYKTCYLDTSDSLRKGGKVAENEFIHLTANARFMENAIAASPERTPLLHEILYPHFPPPSTTGNGAGNIRYAAAATLTVPAVRETIRRKIATLIDQLAILGDKRRDISFSVIVSAVGATGSGTVELLLPLLLEAASNSGINKPNCDIIILHPMMNSTRELLLANAEALYIEMASGQNDALYERFNGRRLIIGSGGLAYTMNNLDELEKTAATLVRLTCDPISGISKHYWDSLPNRHVLRDLEAETSLPTHLSSATPITIGLSNLGQQVMQIDSVRMVSQLILGPVTTNPSQKAPNTLLGLFNFLQGMNSESSYRLLLGRLTARVQGYLDNSRPLEAGMRALSPQQQSDRLRKFYSSGLEYIAQEGPGYVQQQAEAMYKSLITSIQNERTKYVTTDRFLVQLVADFQEVQSRISALQAAAATIKVSPPSTEEEVQRQIEEIARKRQSMGGALRAIQENLTSKCEAEAVQTATDFLNALESECGDTLRRLQSFIQYAYEHYEHRPGWNTDQPHLEAESEYPLYIPALFSEQSISQYYNRVSIFTKSKSPQQAFLSTPGQVRDPLSTFREELGVNKTVEYFFDGRYRLIFELIEQHVNARVQKRLGNAPLLDILEQIDGPVLQDSIRTALGRAQSLIPFTREYAVNSVEEWYVTAHWSTEGQRTQLEKAIKEVSESAQLYRSDDPTEIVVFYLIDGLSLPAIDDLTSRCFQPFLQRRAEWTRSVKVLEKRKLAKRSAYSTMAGTPIYNSYATEERIREQGIVYHLYTVKADSVGEYTSDQVPELAEPDDFSTN